VPPSRDHNPDERIESAFRDALVAVPHGASSLLVVVQNMGHTVLDKVVSHY